MKQSDKESYIIQLIGASILIISTISSVYLSYLDKKSDELKNQTDINICISLAALIAVSLYVIVNCYSYNEAKEKGEDLTPFRTKLLANVVVVIGFCINLYAAIIASNIDQPFTDELT